MSKWIKPFLIPALLAMGMSWILERGYAAYRSNRIYLAVRDSSCNEALLLPGLQKLDSLVTGRSYNRAYYEVIMASNKSGCYVVNYNPERNGLHIKTGETWTDHLEASPDALQRAVRDRCGLAELRQRLRPLPEAVADVFETSQ